MIREAQQVRDALKLRPHSHTRPWQEAMDALDSLLVAVSAAQEFIDTMAVRYSNIEDAEVPGGFTADSRPAAIKLFYALGDLDGR